MRTAQLVVAFAVFVALAFIGYELHQIERELAPGAAFNAGLVRTFMDPRTETATEHADRQRREMQHAVDDALASVGASPHNTKAPAKPSSRATPAR